MEAGRAAFSSLGSRYEGLPPAAGSEGRSAGAAGREEMSRAEEGGANL